MVKLKLNASIHRADAVVHTATIHGRQAWTLLQLIRAGKRGVTAIERPAPRWSDYIDHLRDDHGISIQTHFDDHGGTFAGRHGRYELLDDVKVAGGTLDEYLATPEGRREFGNANFGGAS